MSKDTRVLPHDLEAERSVLGAILIDNSVFSSVAAVLGPQHFFRAAHRTMAKVIWALCDKGQEADLLTVKDGLDKLKALEDIGGLAYLAGLVDGVPRSTNARYYAGIVREKARLVALIRAGSRVVDAAYDAQQEAAEIARTADAELSILTKASATGGAEVLEAGLRTLSADLERRCERKGQISGWPTGFPMIDNLTRGWQARKMIVIAGRTSMGKSVFALNTATAVAKAGGRVLYYSFEMEKIELHQRLLASLSGVVLDRILGGHLTPVELRNIAEAQEVMATLPIEINDTPSMSMLDIRAEARQCKADRGLALVVIDHIQLVDGGGDENRTQELTTISRQCKVLAGELEVPVMVLSQLSRGDKDQNKAPQLHDLRECGAIEQDADFVGMLHPYNPALADTDASVIPTQFLIRKQRGGRKGVVALDLQRDFAQFVHAEPPAPAPPKEKKPTTKRFSDRW